MVSKPPDERWLWPFLTASRLSAACLITSLLLLIISLPRAFASSVVPGKAPPHAVADSASDLDRTIKEAEADLIQRPKDAELRFRLAYALEQRGDAERAMEEYRSVIQLAPGHVWARNNLGVLYTKQGRYDDTIEAVWGSAVPRSAARDRPVELRPRVSEERGQGSGAAPIPYAAETESRQCRCADRRGGRVHGAVSLTGRRANSASRWRSVRNRRPPTGSRQSAPQEGDATGAVLAYRRAADLRPEDAHVRYQLAQALDGDGKRTDAINELRRLLDAPSQPRERDGARGLAEAALRRWGARPLTVLANGRVNLQVRVSR